MNRILTSKWTKAVVFIICLVPAGLLAWGALHNDLGANPLQTLEHTTGDWVLRFLVITLCVTPLRRILKLPHLIRFRRMFGLFAFFYACAHFLMYIGLDQVFDLRGIWADVLKRRYITVGFTGFALMIPLAITSTNAMVRRLGGKRWQQIHRLVYATAILGVIHFYWLVKSDVREPLLYAGIFAILLGWRLVMWLKDGAGKGSTPNALPQREPAPPEPQIN